MKSIKLYSLLIVLCAVPAWGETSNGNDFALYYSEAKTDQERADLLEDAKGRPHYFRYLQVMEFDDSNERAIAITAFEPSSYMDVEFIVTKRVSLEKLKEEPRTKKGDAIAITGVVRSTTKNTLHVGPVIVRHKDQLAPKRGKEMFYEIDPSGTFYSYTGGKRAVSLTYRDRDLLQHKDRVMKEGGNEGWAEFLEQELAKRKKARAAGAKAGAGSGQP